MLRYDQRNAGDEIFGVDLVTPDFAALARSFGITAETVDGLGKDFGEALAAGSSEPGTVGDRRQGGARPAADHVAALVPGPVRLGPDQPDANRSRRL